MADGEAKGEDKILIGIDQRMVNQKDPLQMIAGVMPSGMTEVNKGVSDVDKRDTSKGTVWQKMSIYTKRKKQKRT